MRRSAPQNVALRWQGPRAMPAASLSLPRAATFHRAIRASDLCSARTLSRLEAPTACPSPRQRTQTRTQSNFRPSILLPASMDHFPCRDIYQHSLLSHSVKTPDPIPNQSRFDRILRLQLPHNKYARHALCTTQVVSKLDLRSLDHPPNTLQHRL